jgi:hypothetical protein
MPSKLDARSNWKVQPSHVETKATVLLPSELKGKTGKVEFQRPEKEGIAAQNLGSQYVPYNRCDFDTLAHLSLPYPPITTCSARDVAGFRRDFAGCGYSRDGFGRSLRGRLKARTIAVMRRRARRRWQSSRRRGNANRSTRSNVRYAIFRNHRTKLERTEGVEPTPPLGKSGTLPLSYFCEIYLTAHYSIVPMGWRAKR